MIALGTLRRFRSVIALSANAEPGAHLAWQFSSGRRPCPVTGYSHIYERTGDSSFSLKHHFCPDCGTRWLRRDFSARSRAGRGDQREQHHPAGSDTAQAGLAVIRPPSCIARCALCLGRGDGSDRSQVQSENGRAELLRAPCLSVDPCAADRQPIDRMPNLS